MSKRSTAFFNFQNKLQFTDILENGKKLDKCGVFNRHYKERGDNSVITLIMAKMYPMYEYVLSNRMNSVDRVMIEEDALKDIISKRASVMMKKSKHTIDESGNFILSFSDLHSALTNFGVDCYINHEKIADSI